MKAGFELSFNMNLYSILKKLKLKNKRHLNIKNNKTV